VPASQNWKKNTKKDEENGLYFVAEKGGLKKGSRWEKTRAFADQRRVDKSRFLEHEPSKPRGAAFGSEKERTLNIQRTKARNWNRKPKPFASLEKERIFKEVYLMGRSEGSITVCACQQSNESSRKNVLLGSRRKRENEDRKEGKSCASQTRK